MKALAALIGVPNEPAEDICRVCATYGRYMFLGRSSDTRFLATVAAFDV